MKVILFVIFSDISLLFSSLRFSLSRVPMRKICVKFSPNIAILTEASSSWLEAYIAVHLKDK
jgi:hypothetical protein